MLAHSILSVLGNSPFSKSHRLNISVASSAFQFLFEGCSPIYCVAGQTLLVFNRMNPFLEW